MGHDCLWLFIIVHGSSWIFTTVIDSSWQFITVNGSFWLVLTYHEGSEGFMSMHYNLLKFLKCGAWFGFMIAHASSWWLIRVHDLSWLFMTVHGCSWLFMAIHCCSRLFMAVNALYTHCKYDKIPFISFHLTSTWKLRRGHITFPLWCSVKQSTEFCRP